jgi:hypothetical protein
MSSGISLDVRLKDGRYVVIEEDEDEFKTLIDAIPDSDD